LSDRRTAAKAVGQATFFHLEGRLRWQASSYQGSVPGSGLKAGARPVGAGLPAKAVAQSIQSPVNGRLRFGAAIRQANACNLNCMRFREPGRPGGRFAFAFAFAVYAPSRGRAQVLRSGQPGMDAGLAAPGHGWPMAAGPRSRTGARACRALARHRTKCMVSPSSATQH